MARSATSTAPKAEETTKAVATTVQSTAVAAFDYGSDSGAGFEGTSSKDLSIPFIEVMQSNSPQVEAGDLKLGDMFNSVTGEVWAPGEFIHLIPCHKDLTYNEWVPRSKGGGLVARYQPGDDLVVRSLSARRDGIGPMMLPSGNELIETHYLYALTLDSTGEEVTGFCVLSCTSTKITPLRKLTTALYMLKGKPPLFANRIRLTTFKDKNAKGTYANIEFRPLLDSWGASLINPNTHRGLLEEARAFRDLVTSGVAKPMEERRETVADSGEGATPAGKAPY